MHNKLNLETIKLVINSQNKLEVDLRLQSDQRLRNIDWELNIIEIKIDLNDLAFSSVDNLNSKIFDWLLGVVHLNLKIVNLSEQLISMQVNIKFFNSLIDKIINFKHLKFLKFIIPQVNLFKCLYFKHLAEMPNLTVLDLSEICIQEDAKNRYLSYIVDLIAGISEKSVIKNIILPNYLKQKILSLDADNELFVAIHDALLRCNSLIEVDPLPIFNQLNVPLRTILGRKQGFELESMYLQHDANYETIKQLQTIKDPTPAVKELIKAKTKICEDILADVTKLLPMIEYMLPQNIYWLDKILREKLNDSTYVLNCLYAVQSQGNSEEYLFKILQGLISDLIAGRFVEQDPDSAMLTEFVGSSQDLVMIDDLLKILFKFNLYFSIHKDQDLAKIFSNIVEEFVYGYGGVKKYYDHNRLLPCEKLENSSFLFYRLLLIIKNSYKNKQLAEVTSQEVSCQEEESIKRNQINCEYLAQRNNLLLWFNKFQNHCYLEELDRTKIAYQELDTRLNLHNQLLKENLELKKNFEETKLGWKKFCYKYKKN